MSKKTVVSAQTPRNSPSAQKAARIRTEILAIADKFHAAYCNKKATKRHLGNLIKLSEDLPADQIKGDSKTWVNACRLDWDVAEIFITHELDWEHPADHIAALSHVWLMAWHCEHNALCKKVRESILQRALENRCHQKEAA